MTLYSREVEIIGNYNTLTLGACWLGMNTAILPGIRLGKGTVAGANVVVTKSFPIYSIVAEDPAKIIGSRLH